MEQRALLETKSDIEGNFLQSPERRALLERWGRHIPKTVTNQYSRVCLAKLFENQLKELRTFQEKHNMNEDTTTANTAPFIKYTFPMLRRVWASLIAPEVVSVQPGQMS
jgi:hypothetical protein